MLTALEPADDGSLGGREHARENLDTELAHRVKRDPERVLPVLDVAVVGDDLKCGHELVRRDHPRRELAPVDPNRRNHRPVEGERGGRKPEAAGQSRVLSANVAD